MRTRTFGWDDNAELEKCEDLDREVRHMRRLAQLQAMARNRGEEEQEDEHPPEDTTEA